MTTTDTAVTPLTIEKLAQAEALLNELDLDCWLTFVRETGDGTDPAFPLISDTPLTWQSALIVTRTGERIAIIGSHDAPAVHASGAWTSVLEYIDSIRTPLRETIDRIKPRSIAINYSPDDVKADGLTHGMYLLLQKYLEPYRDRFVSAADLIARLRSRKSEGEIARMKQAIASAERIFDEVAQFATIGTTERAISEFMQGQARTRGLGLAWDPAGCPIVNTGPDSMGGHGIPSGTLAVRPGCLLQIDFGVRENEYCSDMQHVWYVPQEGETKPPPEVIEAFDVVKGAIEAAQRVLKPGVDCHTVDAAARQVVIDAGYPEYDHATGHQVGRCAHDGGGVLGPTWGRYGRTPYMRVEPGQVYTLELGVTTRNGRGYLGLEDMALVTESGCEWLSTPQTEVWLLKSR